MHRLVNVSIIGVALILLAPPPPASAGASGFGWSDSGGVGADVESQLPAEAGPAPSRSASRPRCTYSTMSATEVEIADHMAQNGMGPNRGDGAGTWYWKTCIEDNGMSSATVAWAPQRTDPESVARRALNYAALPDPAIGMSPPPQQGAVVNLPVWLWVKSDAWAPTSANATIDGLTVTTTATPERVVWTVSGGDGVTCEGPGVAYDPGRPEAEQHSDCTYVFREPGTYTVTATVEWRARWVVVGGAGGGDLGVARRSASTTVQVSEIQALNRPPR